MSFYKGTVMELHLARIAAAVCIVVAVPALADLNLSVVLLDGAPAPVESHKASDVPADQNGRRAIQQGAIVHLRFLLENDAAVPSQPVPSRLRPSGGGLSIVVVCPRGDEQVLSTHRWDTRLHAIPLRSLEPHATLVFETWLFDHLDGGTTARPHPPEHKSTFDQPSTYQVYARYTVMQDQVTGDPEDVGQVAVSVESNRVAVEVGAPVPNWDQLQAEGIVRTVEGATATTAEHVQNVANLAPLIQQDGEPSLGALSLTAQEVAAEIQAGRSMNGSRDLNP